MAFWCRGFGVLDRYDGCFCIQTLNPNFIRYLAFSLLSCEKGFNFVDFHQCWFLGIFNFTSIYVPPNFLGYLLALMLVIDLDYL